MTRAVFLDRDGVINQKPPEGLYVTKWEDFHILPGVAEGVALLKQAGFSVIVATNQRCLAKGLMTVADLETLHQQMTNLLARSGAVIEGIYYCPHELEDSCGCRKPAPGMLLEAARAGGIDLASSWMIGDSDIDIEAGRNAGCKTARLIASCGPDENSAPSQVMPIPADIVASSLLDASLQILNRENPGLMSSRQISQPVQSSARPSLKCAAKD